MEDSQIQNPNYTQNTFDTFNEAKSYAKPDSQYYETAANRLQSRMAAQQAGNRRQIQNYYASSGRAGSGGYENSIRKNMNSANNAVATGLADIEQGRIEDRFKTSDALTKIGAGQAGASKVFGDLALGEGALNEEVRSNQRDELLSFFDNYIRGGNLHSSGNGRGAQFDADFQRILQEILGGL